MRKERGGKEGGGGRKGGREGEGGREGGRERRRKGGREGGRERRERERGRDTVEEMNTIVKMKVILCTFNKPQTKHI